MLLDFNHFSNKQQFSYTIKGFRQDVLLNSVADFLYKRWQTCWNKWEAISREIQRLTEANLQDLFELDYVKSQFELHGLRIDTLTFDKESRAFVITCIFS